VHDLSKIPLLLKRLSGPIHLISIPAEQGAPAQLPIDDYRYFIDLEKIGYSIDVFFARFSSKHRKNLRHDLEKLTQGRCEVYHNRIEDFAYMVEQNIRRNENSFFLDGWFLNGFKRMVLAAKESNELEMLSICVDGTLASVHVAILHRSEYLVLLGGNDPNIQNIGKLMMLEHIKNAISKKAKIIDFMSTDTGWKRLWNLDAEPVYSFKK
jgi:CelD/BcsL family acetyltransferase involved in cellulose biosynthesis